MKKILVLFMSMILLSGCLPAFLIGAATGGLVIHEGRNAPEKKKDFELSHRIMRQINQNRALRQHSRITVSSYDGIVLLAGQVPGDALKEEAYELANRVPHIKRIYNEITISGPISSLTQSSDTWITTKVKSVLLATKDLDSSQIKVVTENGVVYLLGKVTHSQAEIAANSVSTIHGVQKVITLFEFTR